MIFLKYLKKEGEEEEEEEANFEPISHVRDSGATDN